MLWVRSTTHSLTHLYYLSLSLHQQRIKTVTGLSWVGYCGGGGTSPRRSHIFLQMKKTADLRTLNSSKKGQNYSSQDGFSSSSNKTKPSRKSSPVVNYIRTATKNVAGVFRFFLGRRKVAASGIAASNDTGRVRRISFSTDISTASNTSRSSTRFRSSSSYSSSSGSNGFVSTPGFSFQEIIKATENFSQANKIGEGGFGAVYKGKLRDGSLVAIKRARKNFSDNHLSMEFHNEVLTLSKIEHLKLVRYYGYVEHGDERLIIVEYVNNGNLREHLDCKRGNGLEMAERLDITIDVAHAITYLHMYADRPIIHRDIKSTNILITDKFRAKVADFGFARLATGDCDATHISTQIKGTTGYLDPEYLKTYQLTEKSDVYSFGVLLVELMTGRNPIEEKRPIKERVTVKWAMQRLKEGDSIFVMDPILRRSPASTTAMEGVLQLARRCVGRLRQSRPSMKECAEELWRIRKQLRETSMSSSSASPAHQSADYPKRDARITRKTTFGIEEDESHRFISA